MTRVLFLTIDLADNSTGRTHVLWQLARHLGWETKVVAAQGARMWAPLRDSVFEDDCVVDDDVSTLSPTLIGHAEWADVIIAVKPLPGALDRGAELSRLTGTPLILDVDDPELDTRLSRHNTVRALAKSVLKAKQYRADMRLFRLARKQTTIVSNPVLQRTYGGVVIPHAREDLGAGLPHASSDPRIVFVGTVRAHKGLGLLREAVGLLKGEGFTLTVTDTDPGDGESWERWVGSTSFDAGLRLVAEGDIVVIPSSSRHAYSRAQLPAKIIDAMIAARAVVVSDIEPLIWATGGAGLAFRSDDVQSLVARLRELRDPVRRQALGDAARSRALEAFTVEACAPALERVVNEISRH